MHRADPRLSRVSAAIALALAVSAAPALAAPADFFLKLPDIDGDSAGKDHKGEIEVLSWSWGANQTSASGLGSGTGSGKMHVQDISAAAPTPAKGKVEYEWKVEEGESAARKTPPVVTLKRGTTSGTETTGGVRVASGDVDGDGTARKASPKLSEAIASGRLSLVVPAGACRIGARYPSVELANAEGGYRMEGATVASCSPGVAGGSRPTESMSLNFTKVEYQAKSMKDGIE